MNTNFYQRILLIILTILSGQSIHSQLFYDRHKMSDYLCELVNTSTPNFVKGVHGRRYNSVTTLVKFYQDGCASPVSESYGCQLIDSIGQIYFVRVPIDKLGPLSLDSRVMRIDAHEMPKPAMDEVPIRVGASISWSGTLPLPQAFTGEGVLAGVVDIGFDFTHPMFLDKDGKSRILQFYAPVTDADGAFHWSTYNSHEIMKLKHSPFATHQYHGTHVASIMAGSAVAGENGNYSGIAPKSDIVLVEFGTDSVGSSKSLATTADLVLYIKRLFDEAGALNRPCVVNLSAGGYVPITDDMSIEDDAIESMLGAGRILVTSAGNDGNWNATLSKKENVNEVWAQFYGVDEIGQINLEKSGRYSSQAHADQIVCYLVTDNPQTIHFHFPEIVHSRLRQVKAITITTDSIDLVADNEEEFCIEDTIPYGHVMIYASRKPETNRFYGFVIKIENYEDVSFSNYIASQPIIISISGEHPCELYTSPYDTPFIPPSKETGFEVVEGSITPAHTIGWPASVDDAIAIGNLCTRSWASRSNEILDSTSSQGPSWTGHQKPEAVAPGVNIRAAYDCFFGVDGNVSHFYDTIKDGQDNEHYILSTSGTSMSSPIVAGAIALWLQAKPDLTPEEIKEVLSETCSHPVDGEEYPNNRYGYGEIDVYRGLLHILGLPDRIENLSAHQPTNVRFHLSGRFLTVVEAETLSPITESVSITVYSIAGRKLKATSGNSIDLSNLPHGVYAIQVKTDKKETTGSTLVRF